jgi:probable rRNA maturation factor
MLPHMAGRRTAKPIVTISSAQRAMRVPRKKIAALIAHAVAAEKARVAEVDVAVVAADEMASLNRRFLGHRGPTDVLSFDLSGPGEDALVAQIIVCGDVAVREARRRRLRPQRELLLYVLHGLLHLIGYDDTDADAAARMHAREEELLAALPGAARSGSRRPPANG